MDDEHDENRSGDESSASEVSAESENREGLETPMPEEPAAPEYTPEEYELAQGLKSRRLYKEENGRIPYNAGELTHFLLKANIERPIVPDDEDLQAARRKLEASDS